MSFHLISAKSGRLSKSASRWGTFACSIHQANRAAFFTLSRLSKKSGPSIWFQNQHLPLSTQVRAPLIKMSAGFGFSVGDFITGIQLVRDVITSLQASGGPSSEYQALAMELFSLEPALLEVKALKSLDDQPKKLKALKWAASRCQHTIDRFMTKIQKFQSSLTTQGSGSRWRDGLRKIQWACVRRRILRPSRLRSVGMPSQLTCW